MRKFFVMAAVLTGASLCSAQKAPCFQKETPAKVTVAGMGVQKDIAFKSNLDGTEQRYVEIKPEKFTPDKKYDMLIALHGHGSDRWQFVRDKRGECAAARDFAAGHDMFFISPDYRAKTSWMGPTAEADLLQIIDDVKKRNNINRVFIMGGSMGGTSALTFTALHPELISGVTSLNGHANHLEYANFQDAIAESFGGPKDKIPEEYKKRSAEFWPEKFTMPVALTTGGKDTSVPPASARRLAEALKKAGAKVFIIHRPEDGHATDYADSMAALEFMLTGEGKIPDRTATGGKPVAAPGKASVSGEGGFFFKGSPAPSELNAKGNAELGLKFSVEKAGKISAFYFIQARTESGPHELRLWDASGKKALSVTAPEAKGPAWVKAPLKEPLIVKPGETYTLSYTAQSNYPGTPCNLGFPIKRGGLTALAGVYSFEQLGAVPPSNTYNNLNYFLDLDYTPATGE